MPWFGCSRTSAAPRPRRSDYQARRGAREGESIHLNDRGRRRARHSSRCSPRGSSAAVLFAARPGTHEPLRGDAGTARRSPPVCRSISTSTTSSSRSSRTLSSRPTAARASHCWQHSTIPDLARALGVPAPPKWRAADRPGRSVRRRQTTLATSAALLPRTAAGDGACDRRPSARRAERRDDCEAGTGGAQQQTTASGSATIARFCGSLKFVAVHWRSSRAGS